jgi:hypothetical protein
MIFKRMDENGRASLGLANNNDAVDTNCAGALVCVHGLTVPVLDWVVKMAAFERLLHGDVTPDKERKRRESGAYWKNV